MAAKREQRVLLAEVRAGEVATVAPAIASAAQSAEDVLIGLLADVAATLQQLKARVSQGDASATLLVLLGDWVDRVERVSRSVIATGAQERVNDRRAKLSQEQADQLVAQVFVAVNSADLNAGQRLAVIDALLDGIAGRVEVPAALPAGVFTRWIATTRADALRAEEAAEAEVIEVHDDPDNTDEVSAAVSDTPNIRLLRPVTSGDGH